MAPATTLSAAAPRARGGQERAARTRALVVQEMVACVLEEGYAAASARRVAHRAGVTWGVVQYHFGDRDGILAAVIEQGYAELQRSLDDLTPTTAAPRSATQIEQLVDSAFAAFDTDLSRAVFEILVATRTDRDSRIDRLLRKLAVEVHQLGATLTGDPAVGEVMWAAIRGMVLNRMMSARNVDTSTERRALARLIRGAVDG